MPNYNEYGEVAINVAKTKGNPEENWKAEVKKDFFDSISSQKKNCPKSAFLGLCEKGLVKGIPEGKYTRSIDNKAYAVKAIDILKSNTKTTYTPKELWEELNLGDKRPNSQMDVVLALWENGLIK
ncbi:hypothetical protein NBRC110019_03770 [Neptunitalea chrysea]|uniref:Uncharacterized protein n=1 Tax=Neptunitalea chrysea TaxID=1647581 RepID=A0A9W6EVB7_9FLAO|nr:hypothetical protein [Neptunitalea chrysea]GLB51338.1 hypothetical protein NBRC110019_03770 [Neptunitalea chrysea]